MGIEGVPKPEKIVPKPAGEKAADAKVGEKVASAASAAADAIKTAVVDTDDAQDHNEL